MFSILAHIRPLDPQTGERVDVRVASASTGAALGLGRFTWESAITRRPSGSIELFSLDLSPGTRVPTMNMAISLSAIHEVDASGLVWSGAPITVYRADDLTWPAPVEFEGYISRPVPDLDDDSLAITAQVSTKRLEQPLLTAEFDGSGGLGGDPDKRTTLKPAGFGVCLNLEPVLYDAVRNMFMLDGYGNLLSVEWLGEGLSSLGECFADFATASALASALDSGAVPPGRWASCIADGVVGLGAPPEGVITCHATFGYGMTGALIRRAAITHAGFPADKLLSASFDALDADVPYPVHYWTATQVEVKELAESLAAGCNASPIVTFQGGYGVVRPFGGDSMGVFTRRGFSDPPVTAWKSADVLAPHWRIRARVARPVRVMDLGEVLYVDEFNDRGLYDAATIYRQGNIVWLKNKSQWLYINETPDKGHAPPETEVADAYWVMMAPAPDATDLRYQDGTPIEDFKPAEPGAQISRNLSLSETTRSFTLDKDGVLAPGQLPFVLRATMSAANFDVTRQTVWSLTVSEGIVAAIDNDPGSQTRGQVTIQGVTKAGTIQVHGIHGGVAQSQSFTITTKGALADASLVGSGLIEVGAVTGSVSFTGPDIEITDVEKTMVEHPALMLGDTQDGRGIYLVTFNHDSSERVDTGCEIRVYADYGAGFQQIAPEKRQGIRTQNGNTYWAMNVAFAFAIASLVPVKVKITVKGIQIAGTGSTSGSYARSPSIVLFTGER